MIQTKWLFLFCLFTAAIFAQLPSVDAVSYYSASYEADLSNTTDGFTIQVPQRAATSTYLVWVTVYCQTGCTVSQAKNGTSATGLTSVTSSKLNSDAASEAVAYGATNSTGGSALQSVRVPSDFDYPLDMQAVVLRRGAATPQNYTIRLAAAMTGKFRVSVIYYQK